MKFFTYDLKTDEGSKETNFRLTSANSMEIEKKNNCSLLDYINDINMTRCVNLLRYMRKGEKESFNEKDACDLFDEMADCGLALEDIYMDIIFPCCVHSGLIKEDDYKAFLKAREVARENQMASIEEARSTKESQNK